VEAGADSTSETGTVTDPRLPVGTEVYKAWNPEAFPFPSTMSPPDFRPGSRLALHGSPNLWTGDRKFNYAMPSMGPSVGDCQY
jgi:hypothetical protein